MSIPAILGALAMGLKDVAEAQSPDITLVLIGLVGSVISGAVGYGAILWLVRFVKSRRLDVFSYYLLALGCFVLAWSFLRG
jgi:undecaprenyl pyrophosphate phosphatase UppP